MKKFALTLLLAVSAFTSWAQFDFSAVAPTGQTLYYNISGSNALVTAPALMDWGRYASPIGSLTIPSSVTYGGITYTVTSIENTAFHSCIGLTSVSIPNTVTSIGDYAFEYCEDLTSITIPNSVTSIGVAPFTSCSCFTSIIVDANNSHYDSRNNCNAIIETASNTLIVGCQNTTIPNSVTSIGDFAFYSCNGLTNVNIPSSVTSIGYCAFATCHSLTDVNIPNSVTSIGDFAFANCSSLTSVDIPNSVTSIGDYAFMGGFSLTSVDIPNSVTEIGGGTFIGCSSLTSFTIPNSVTEIGDEAFDGCNSLSSITCNASAAPILGESAFLEVPSSANIYIPCGSTASYQSEWGNYFSNFIEHPFYSITLSSADPTQGSASVSAQPTCTNSTAVITATPAPDYRFRQWSDGNTDNPRTINLTQDTALTAIFSSQYYDFSAVAPSGQTLYYKILSSHTVCVTHPGSCDIVVCWGDYTQPTGDLIIPSTVSCSGTTYSVTEIGEDAFNWCSRLTSVTIPNSVISIGDFAFYDCTGLTSITIPNSVTSIGRDAFAYCEGLTSITIPNSVTFIGDDAFFGCERVTSIIVDANNEHYDSRNNCNAIIETASNTLIFGCQNTTIPNSVTSIGYYAFYSLHDLTSVTIPNSVTSIGAGAFNSCSSLTDVTIPNSVTSIGDYAFSYCLSLTSIDIPNSVTSISGGTFIGSTSLTSINIPNSVTEIGGGTFIGCTSLTSVTIPNSVTEIGSEAFDGCTSLSSITCNAAVAPTLGESVFSDVPSSANIYIPCGSTASYQSEWGTYFSNFIEHPIYSITLSSADSTQGSASVTTQPTCSTSAVITATPAPDCRFRQWSDGNTDNPRTITLTQDTSFVAIFSNLYYDFSAVAPTGQTLYYKILSSHTVCVTHPGNSDFVYCWNGYTQPTGDLVIPSTVRYSGTTYSVTEIGQSAFYDCTGLTSITIPNSVTSINNSAFFSCDGLSSVTIPNSVTSIGDFAFLGCFSLTGVTIPRSVNSIGDAIFVSCVSLNYIIVDANNTHYDSRNNCNAIIETASNTLICGCQTTTIPNSVTSIGDNAFYNCVYLPSVTIPNSVTYIGNNAFEYCGSLTSVIIPNSVTSIGSGAFSGCGSLISVTIPNSVTYIGNNAFEYCGSLTSITCDAATAPALGESAFSDVPSSASIYIPCGSTASYQSAWGEYFSNFIEPASYSITASAADPTQGSAAAVIQPTCTTAVITATPAPDYHFRQWNDGNTDNPRTLTLTQDTSLTAFFSARPQHDTVYIHDTTYIHDTVYVTLFLRDSTIIYGSHDTIFVHDTVRDCHEQQLFVLVNNDTLGACAGSGTYPLGSTVQIMAIPNRGQRFLCWSDGVTTNPRTITLTGNLTFTAIFFKQDD